MIPLSEKTPLKKFYSAFFGQEFLLDLALIAIWLAASITVIYFPLPNAALLRAVLSIPVVLIFPGYSLLAAVFPKNDSISLMERVALSVGLSFVIVPLIGLGLNFTPLGIRLDSMMISLTLFIWVMNLVGCYRRVVLLPDERFKLPFFEITGILSKGSVRNGGSRIDQILTGILTLVIIFALLTAVYVIVVPREGERFTEFYILGEKQMVADYPEEIISGQNYSIFIGVGNHEFRNTSYTIETWTLQTEFDNVTNISSVIAMDPSDRQILTLGHNETKVIPSVLSVNDTKYNQIAFLLFNESVPDPGISGIARINASYRELHLWVTVR
jgi:uncharacterized membrane protein